MTVSPERGRAARMNRGSLKRALEHMQQMNGLK